MNVRSVKLRAVGVWLTSLRMERKKSIYPCKAKLPVLGANAEASSFKETYLRIGWSAWREKILLLLFQKFIKKPKHVWTLFSGSSKKGFMKIWIDSEFIHREPKNKRLTLTTVVMCRYEDLRGSLADEQGRNRNPERPPALIDGFSVRQASPLFQKTRL